MSATQQTITCVFCKKSKPLNEFSPRQCVKHGPKRCLDCTHQSVTHVKCKTCSKNKPVDKYSNNQRKLGDRNAVCSKCMHRCKEEDVWCSEPGSSGSEVV